MYTTFGVYMSGNQTEALYEELFLKLNFYIYNAGQETPHPGMYFRTFM